MDAVTHPPTPVNEPVLDYAPGSAERAALTDLERERAYPADLLARLQSEIDLDESRLRARAR